MNYATGTTVKITSEQDKSIDQIVEEATAIWKRAATLRDTVTGDALTSQMQREHKEFCTSYPIVNRYICQMGQYSPKAFRLWLGKIATNPWKGETEYLDAQADYVSMLFRVKNPRASTAHVGNIRKNIRAALQLEHDKFKYYVQEYDREVTAAEGTLRDRGTDELRSFAALCGPAGMLTAETLRIDSDTSGNCDHASIIQQMEEASAIPLGADMDL